MIGLGGTVLKVGAVEKRPVGEYLGQRQAGGEDPQSGGQGRYASPCSAGDEP